MDGDSGKGSSLSSASLLGDELRVKLCQLETEIERYRAENGKLERLRREREEVCECGVGVGGARVDVRKSVLYGIVYAWFLSTRDCPCSRQRWGSFSVRKRRSSDDSRSTRERRPGNSGGQSGTLTVVYLSVWNGAQEAH